MDLTDTHCHLDFHNFDDDREEVILRAVDAGLVRLLNPGLDVPSSLAAIQLSERHRQVYAAVGVHPNDSTTWEESSLDELRSFAAHEKVVAVGEIGLDYYREHAPRDVQQRVFHAQLELAAELGLPVIIHNRDATGDVFAALEKWHAGLVKAGSLLAEQPGVLHSFSGGMETAERARAMNFYLGINGPVTFEKAGELRETVRGSELSQMLIETDAPFLTPHPHRGKRNEPAYVRLVAEKIAEVREMRLEDLVIITAGNAARLFAW